MIKDILPIDYLNLFKDTCSYYISKFSDMFNIDITNYNISYGTINHLDGYRSICGHDSKNKYNKSLGINVVFCFMQINDPNSDIARYEKVSDFIKDLALHEVCHLFNHLVNPDKSIIENRGHDKWFKELYEPLRKQYTNDKFVVRLEDGVEYNNFSDIEVVIKNKVKLKDILEPGMVILSKNVFGKNTLTRLEVTKDNLEDICNGKYEI